MTLFLLSMVVFGLSFFAMALGALLGRRPLASGCATAAVQCAACVRPCSRRKAAAE